MRQRWGIRLLVRTGALLFALRGAGAEAQRTLAEQIGALTNESTVARDHWGVVVTTLDGKILYGKNEGQLFQPASNAKLFTTAAAMALLGRKQRFTTRLEYRTAAGQETTIDGDVVLVGTGDANLNGDDLPYTGKASQKNASLRYLAAFADQIAASGVTRITGNVIGDDTAFPWEPYPEDWAIDDMVWGYGAPVSALTIADNQLQLTMRPGKTVADLPSVDWQAGLPAYYTVDRTDLVTGLSGTGDLSTIERAPGSKVLRIAGSIAMDAAPDREDIAIGDPAEFAAMALREMLSARGVIVDGTARAKHRQAASSGGFLRLSMQSLPGLPKIPIAEEASAPLTGKVPCRDACPVILEHTSPTVEEDIVFTNKTSQNLHAELLLRHLGEAYGTNGSTAQGARVVRQFLVNAGLEKDDFVFFDGSGLSGHDLVTPRATARLLAFAAGQPWFAAWKASLPVGGVDGSLSGRFKEPPLKGRVFAKTGTLGEARALSGYVECASGRTVIFSIMDGQHLPGTSVDREVMDRIVAAVAAAN